MFPRPGLVAAVLEEVENAVEDVEGEVQRMLELEKLGLAVEGPGTMCTHCQDEGDPWIRLELSCFLGRFIREGCCDAEQRLATCYLLQLCDFAAFAQGRRGGYGVWLA